MSSRLHIIHVLRNLKYGGCQTLALTLIQNLADHIHTVVYLNNEEDYSQSMHREFIEITPCVFIPQSSKRLQGEIRSLHSRRESMPLVLNWFFPFMLLPGRLPDWPCIHHVGTSAFALSTKAIIKQQAIFILSRLIDTGEKHRIVCASRHVARSFRNRFAVLPPNFGAVIPNGTSPRTSARTEPAQNLFTFAMIGRLDGSKDFASFILFSKAMKSLLPNACRFLIIGDGSHFSSIASFNIRHGSPCDMVGLRTSRASLYQDVDCLVFFNTEEEGFGNVIIEAMHEGIPVITHSIGASNEIITDGFDGFTVKRWENALAPAQLLATDYDIWRKIGAMGQVTARTRYSADTFARSYLQVAQALLS